MYRQPEEEKLLNIAEASRYLNISEQAVRLWISQRKLGCVRLGKCIRLPLDELDRLIAAGTVEPTPQAIPDAEHV